MPLTPARPMDSARDRLATLRAGLPLSPEEVEAAVAFLLDEKADTAAKAEFLRALAAKGETDGEIASFVEALLKRALDPGISPGNLSGPMLDVCGTGGDRLDLFNISTTSMFVLAAGGAVVVKHGGRSVSSQCGSADVLEALGIGIGIDLTPDGIRRCLDAAGCCFLFAPHYHPAFKAIGPLRKTLAAEGVVTIFNLLGPLLNPARPAHQLVGIFSEAALPKYAGVLQRLGRKHAWAVHGRACGGVGMDEVSTMGPTRVHAVAAGGLAGWAITPEELAPLGLLPATLEDLRGGNREENARTLEQILDGSLRGPKRDIVTLNAAAGFVVANLASTLADGFAMAREAIDSGRALEKLRTMQRLG